MEDSSSTESSFYTAIEVKENNEISPPTIPETEQKKTKKVTFKKEAEVISASSIGIYSSPIPLTFPVAVKRSRAALIGALFCQLLFTMANFFHLYYFTEPSTYRIQFLVLVILCFLNTGTFFIFILAILHDKREDIKSAFWSNTATCVATVFIMICYMQVESLFNQAGIFLSLTAFILLGELVCLFCYNHYRFNVYDETIELLNMESVLSPGSQMQSECDNLNNSSIVNVSEVESPKYVSKEENRSPSSQGDN